MSRDDVKSLIFAVALIGAAAAGFGPAEDMLDVYLQIYLAIGAVAFIILFVNRVFGDHAKVFWAAAFVILLIVAAIQSKPCYEEAPEFCPGYPWWMR